MATTIKLTAATTKRFSDDIRRIKLLVDRQFVLTGLVPRPLTDDRDLRVRFNALQEAQQADEHAPLEAAVAAYESGQSAAMRSAWKEYLIARRRTRLATVYVCGLGVQRAFEGLTGQRETAIERCEAASAGIRGLDALIHTSDGCAYLASIAAIGPTLGFQDDVAADSSEVLRGLASLDWSALRNAAEAADAAADNFRTRRSPELFAAYGPKGAGPISHFCFNLRRTSVRSADPSRPLTPLDLEEITDIAGLLPPYSKFASKQRAQEARDQAIDAVRRRVARFGKAVRAATPA